MSPQGPLVGIRVLDLSSVLMGPVATRTLGDMGADVIVIEPEVGDRNRGMGPGPHEQFSGITLNLMRNKRSVSLDLKQAKGRQAMLDIAANALVSLPEGCVCCSVREDLAQAFEELAGRDDVDHIIVEASCKRLFQSFSF